jgi:phage/plasmid-like protein (TIGR03299 family)
MSDAVERFSFGQAFASRAVPAWHGLGTVFDNSDDVTTEQMLRLAYLNDWNVRLVPLADVLDFDSYASDQFLVVRNNPDGGDGVLGVVGARYTVYQNESLLDFGDTLLDGGGRWETAGSIRNGTQVFASMAFTDSITLDPNGRADKIDKYLLLNTSHDGSTTIQASNTMIRVVCANTLGMALKGAKQTYKIRHSAKAEANVVEARAALAISFAYADAFEAEAQAMIQTEITKSDFDKIVESLYPKPEADVKGAVKKWTTKVDLIESIYLGAADGPDTNANVRGTKWGAFNALTERLDWYRKPRAGNIGNVLLSSSGFDLATQREKQRIFEAVKAL